MNMLRLISGIAVVLWAATASAQTADTPTHAARKAAQDISAATLALQDATKSRDRVAALTKTIQAFEAGLSAMREGLRQAAIREAAIRLKFDAQREELTELLGAMQSIEASPTPLLLLHPSGPLGNARSGMILSDIAPSLQARADELRRELEEVAVLRALHESAEQSLREGLFGIQEARTELSQAISERSDLPRRFTEDPEQLQSLIVGSETLEAFASGLVDNASDTAPLATEAFDTTKGLLSWPVEGRLLRAYGEADAAGIERPGLILATTPRALVTAPWPATIRYRGPLLDYGNVMILEPQSGYLLVLAGMQDVYGEVGQVVPKDTPVGLMGGQTPKASEFLQNSVEQTGTSRSETLYIEIRQDKSPVDPTPWFSVTKE